MVSELSMVTVTGELTTAFTEVTALKKRNDGDVKKTVIFSRGSFSIKSMCFVLEGGGGLNRKFGEGAGK